ncbi:MAG TPA: 4-coumarate--CoA ligase, partial [Idiomarina abyssalis]|nr:4-coumarate--CoA ligase [Idiomarina abyssalis]
TLLTFDLPDSAAWKNDSEFQIKGRVDKAISIRGTNVFPDHVADCLRQHPDIADATVRPLVADEGTGLKAFIVLQRHSENAMTEQSLKNWLSERLLAAEVPQHISFGKQLPLNTMGKACDWAIDKP